MQETEAERIAAFQRLADQRLDASYALATAILRNDDEAQDAVHDAVIRAWKRRASLRDRARFDAWCDRIVVNVCRDRLKANRVRWRPISSTLRPSAHRTRRNTRGDPLSERDLDLALDRLGAEHVRRTAPPALRARVHAVPVETPQRRGWLRRIDQGGFDMYSALRFVAAGAVLALFGGFLLAGVLTQQQSDVVVPAAATESPAATATSDAVSDEPVATVDAVAPSPRPDATSPASLVAGPGPWLTWERAPELDLSQAEFDERLSGASDDPPFPKAVAAWRTGEQGGYALGFIDGDATRSDPHGLLDGYVPLRLWVKRSDGSIEKHVMDRACGVRNVAVGPAGILIRTEMAVSEGGIEQSALAGLFRQGELRNTCCDLQADGSWTTDGSAGLPRLIEFGQYRDKLERIGLRRTDLTGPRYWLWRDGEGWGKAKAPPEHSRRDHVRATEDGYFTLGKDGRLHFSADLQDWDVILEPDGQQEQELYRLDDRLLYVSDDEIAWVGPDGLEPTPFGQAIGEAGPLRSLGSSYGCGPSRVELLPWPDSEAGLVLIHADTDSVLFTPDGERWGLAPLAAPHGFRGWDRTRATAFEIRDGQLVQYDLEYGDQGSDGMASAYRAVVTDEPSA